MKINTKKLIKHLAVPLAVGGISGFLTMNAMKEFSSLNQPPLSPPGWLFPVVWTGLYTLMGISAYIVEEQEEKGIAAGASQTIYYYQLVVNFLWPIFFFCFKWRLFSLLWLILLWVLIIAMIRIFSGVSKKAAYINIPYLIWTTFATYLNAGVWFLNR